MLWRVIRRLLAVVIRTLIWRPIVSLTVVAIALGVAGIAISGMNGPRLLEARALPGAAQAGGDPAASPSPIVRSAPPTTPPPAVEEYIDGMTTFNAHLMWEALDPQAIQAMESQGGSEQFLQQKLDDAKQKGARYESVAFIGGYPLRNGDRYFFYVVSRRGFDQTGGADQVFFVFTVGPNGKILKIE